MSSKYFSENRLQTINDEILYQGEEIQFLLRETPYGKKPILNNSPSSAIVAMENINNLPHIVLVRQFRYGCFCDTLEIPAGKSKANESPIDCARRELQEECGLSARQWQELYSVHPSVGLLSEKLHVFLAENFLLVETNPDEDEEIEIIKIPIGEFYSMLDKGEIIDAKTMLAGFYLQKHFPRFSE